MADYNALNYTEQGGNITHIGGKLVIEDGAEVEGLPSPSVPKAANQAASEASTVVALKEDFNALLSKLKTAGLMEADEEPEQPEENTTPDPGNEPGGEGEQNQVDTPPDPGLDTGSDDDWEN